MNNNTDCGRQDTLARFDPFFTGKEGFEETEDGTDADELVTETALNADFVALIEPVRFYRHT